MAILSAAEKKRAIEILIILQSNLSIRASDFASILVNEESHDPFRVLVVTILSQSCTDIAAVKAYRRLEKRIRITPRSLAQAEVKKISNSIRVAGLHRQKSKALKQLAQLVSQDYSGDISQILQKPAEEARAELQNLPQVGPKTADVLLSIWGSATISVDTHVERVSKRLGLTPSKATYARIRSDLMQLFEVEDYGKIPLLFMAHGRSYCKAIRPLCSVCPVRRLCAYSSKA
ncbi:MAG: endonuclease III [Candidatus Bathyarchaeia archaeon]